ncbi:ATP-binding cassette domain-containing protein [Rhodobacteraceae bacterium RKSG542]|uniref:amino acid ABC transporter ATP-binding/permease protein n=1 Tax=Pseudovibrio flavus TaxID=2529854 RepID=UPI0012BB8D9D|nr:ATP-binding cassette domain-containing protein [Pseudovibrio flavus]MTI17112.1 ATP-binding cassette domain-containing protein [Pseudovibrio flavus]
MIAVLRIIKILIGAAPWAMARGAALAVVVLLMGAALLGLSGWFITATGLAGLAGIGIMFDVFKPSAGVRLLALGRTAARYGERLLTHDATLRALAALRVDLLKRQALKSARALSKLRGEVTLTRIITDVDILDGLVLRLLLPVSAAIITHVVAFLMLAWLVGSTVALTIALVYLPIAAIILWHLASRTNEPSRAGEACQQALRRGVIDMIRDRTDLILSGRLGQREGELLDLDAKTRVAQRLLDHRERIAGMQLTVLVSLATAAALVAGGYLIEQGAVSAPLATIGVFVALALAETILPLRRGFADLGRMFGAAQRISGEQQHSLPSKQADTHLGAAADECILRVTSKTLSFEVGRGASLVITGPSGAGKTTLLMQIAGLGDDARRVDLNGSCVSEWGENDLRSFLTMVPQRSGLIAGSIFDNLALSGCTDESDMWQALHAVELADDIEQKGGLHTRLGEAGSGLSGGQARRLSLARAILRRPQVLLLDEPTEGLDEVTAERVLYGIRQFLPDATIIAAMHRGSDHPLFEQRVQMLW